MCLNQTQLERKCQQMTMGFSTWLLSSIEWTNRPNNLLFVLKPSCQLEPAKIFEGKILGPADRMTENCIKEKRPRLKNAIEGREDVMTWECYRKSQEEGLQNGAPPGYSRINKGHRNASALQGRWEKQSTELDSLADVKVQEVKWVIFFKSAAIKHQTVEIQRQSRRQSLGQ